MAASEETRNHYKNGIAKTTPLRCAHQPFHSSTNPNEILLLLQSLSPSLQVGGPADALRLGKSIAWQSGPSTVITIYCYEPANPSNQTAVAPNEPRVPQRFIRGVHHVHDVVVAGEEESVERWAHDLPLALLRI